MLHDEGYIQFLMNYTQRRVYVPIPQALLQVRDRLHRMGMIGVYPDGVGYGNVSMRIPGTSQFLITGTRTGQIFPFTQEAVCLVTHADISSNSVNCTGLVPASSESMTHAACYFSRADIEMVIHVHHAGLWQTLMYTLPTTAADITYGTPAMACAIGELCASGGPTGLIVASGHQDGIFVYGTQADLALSELIRHYATWSAKRG